MTPHSVTGRSRTCSSRQRSSRFNGWGPKVAGLIVVEPLPVAPLHVRSCMTGAKYADECAFVTDSKPSPAEIGYRSLAARIRNVSSLDIDAISCPRMPVCDALVTGTLVRSDYDHLTPRYVGAVADEIDWALHSVGAL